MPLALLIAAAMVLGYIGRLSQWRGVWPETLSHTGTALIFALPAAAAAGAWVGAGSKRGGFESLQGGSSRSKVVVALRDHGETCFWSLLGYLLGASPAAIMTLSAHHVGQPQGLAVLAQMSCIAAFTVLGQLIGTRVPWYLGAPLCAVATYLLLGLGSFVADSALVALTPIDERWMTFQQIYWWVFLGQCFVWTLLAFSAILRRSDNTKGAVIAVWVAGLIAAPLLYVTPATRHVDPHALVMRCDVRRTVSICLPSGKALLRDDLTHVIARNQGLVGALFADRVAYVDDEIRGLSKDGDANLDSTIEHEVDAGREVVLFSQASDLSARTQLDANQFFLNLAGYVFAPPKQATDSTASADKPVASPQSVLQHWYLKRVGVPTDGTAGYGAPALDATMLDYGEHARLLKEFPGWSSAQRDAWFTAHREAIRGGTLEWSDFETTPTR